LYVYKFYNSIRHISPVSCLSLHKTQTIWVKLKGLKHRIPTLQLLIIWGQDCKICDISRGKWSSLIFLIIFSVCIRDLRIDDPLVLFCPVSSHHLHVFHTHFHFFYGIFHSSEIRKKNVLNFGAPFDPLTKKKNEKKEKKRKFKFSKL